MEMRLAACDHAVDGQDLHRLFHGDEFVLRFFGNRFHAMKRALIERAGGGKDRAVGDAVLLNDVLYGFKQPIAAIQTDSVYLSDLRAAETLGAETRQDEQ